MDEQEKREIVEAINGIRKEIGLEPYPLEQLEAKGLEELRKLYSACFAMREAHRKRLKEEKKFKLNLKTGLLIGILIIVVVSVLLVQAIFEPLISLLLGAQQRGTDFNIWFSYYKNNQSVFFLQNRGIDISYFKIKLDGNDVEYSIESGKLPLNINEEISFVIKDFICDDQEHEISVTVENTTKILRLKGCA